MNRKVPSVVDPGPTPPPGRLTSAAPSADPTLLAALLQYESDVRRKASVAELCYFVANDSRHIVGYDQMFILSQKLVGTDFKVMCASSIATVDRNAPLIQAIEQRFATAVATGGAAGGGSGAWTDAGRATDGPDDALSEYPFPHCVWQRLIDAQGDMFGALVTMHAVTPAPDVAIRLARIADTVAHSWRALTGNRPVSRIRRIGPRERIGFAVLALGIAIFPVRLSVLAPFEVVAERPFVIAAPYSGVVARIHVNPNALVRRNQLVLTLEDIQVRGEMQQAAERLRVAQARIDRSSIAAFSDADQAAGLSTLRADYEVAQADYALARDMMRRSQISAPRAGMAIYSDRRDWEGRAVNIGDPILQIVDPDHVVVRVEMPTREQLALRPGGDARLWLDSQPLWAIDGRIESASFQSRPTASGVLAFAVVVRPIGHPRIGSRGTARLYGQWVPLCYAALRRPIASIRQYLGL
jgi:hypothetical protein